MRRFILVGALTGALFAAAAQAQAQVYYRRPVGPVRAAVRAALPPYGYPGPAYYGRPAYYRYWGPGGFWW